MGPTANAVPGVISVSEIKVEVMVISATGVEGRAAMRTVILT
jgi:hypothetical protein